MADVEKAGVGDVIESQVGAGVAASPVRKRLLTSDGLAHQRSLGVDVGEEGSQAVNLVYTRFTRGTGGGEVKGGLEHVKGGGVDQGGGAVGVLLKEVHLLRGGQGARGEKAGGHIDGGGVALDNVLGQTIPAVKDSCTRLASQMPCLVLDQVGLVLALLRAHVAYKVRLSCVAFNVPVQMALLCKRFLADIASERSVNDC